MHVDTTLHYYMAVDLNFKFSIYRRLLLGIFLIEFTCIGGGRHIFRVDLGLNYQIGKSTTLTPGSVVILNSIHNNILQILGNLPNTPFLITQLHVFLKVIHSLAFKLNSIGVGGGMEPTFLSTTWVGPGSRWIFPGCYIRCNAIKNI